MQKPRTTLFMLMSFDGKISTGIGKGLDFDKDLPNIKGIKEGLNQYYELEQKTDIVSFNSGKVMAKIGVNTPKNPIKNIKGKNIKKGKKITCLLKYFFAFCKSIEKSKT